MPYFYVKVQKNIDICNFLNGYYCHFYGVRGLFQCPPFRGDGREVRNDEVLIVLDITDPLYLPLKRGGLVCLPLESPWRVLMRYSKTLSINFSASKQTASLLQERRERGNRRGSLFSKEMRTVFLPQSVLFVVFVISVLRAFSSL